MKLIPRFKEIDLKKHIEQQLAKLDAPIIARLQLLGEECVKMSREAVNLHAGSFPIKYGDSSKNQTLKQRRIGKSDTYKNPGVRAPKFGDYLDYTSNLRNSIGYVIVKDGKVIRSSFGSKSQSTAKTLTSQLSGRVPKGYGLIVVAGMEYAAAVESKGYNVITSAEHFARVEMPNLIKSLKNALK